MLADELGSVAVSVDYRHAPETPHPGPLHDCYAAPIRTSVGNTFGWESLFGQPPGSASTPEYAVAARAKDLSGLAPAFLAVGALDLLLDESVEYATELLRAGVPTELHGYPGAPHGIGTSTGRPATSVDQELKATLKQAFTVQK
ncbi:alpha/beta hydrolase [Streptomyces sp. TLI_146]|uniref:alpha/beta hydrolase n=1 Tax=Streptomyces sp. TLI_146 TaxID=1938858 RepID=UPI001C59DB7F|nr:alpha/beta hydrolase fold domain-containing protein [Streptomyces sp. TLI_146]